MKSVKRIISLCLIVVFLFTGCFITSAQDYIPYLTTMLQFVKDMYYQDVSYDALFKSINGINITDEASFQSALKALVGHLDKYSAYFDNKETEVLNNALNGNYVGIGAGLEKSGSFVRINKIYEGSPAEKAGLYEGDILISVDDKSIANKKPEDVATSIRGNAGTSVKLIVKRGTQTKTFTIVRGTVTINPVQYRLEGKTAYIRIDSFSQGCSQKFSEAMAQVNQKQIKKIILDLRGNPGGYVDEAVSIAEKLIPPGVITTLDYKSETMTDRVYAADEQHPSYMIAVLVDEGSASASEILAGAIEDSGCGILIGQKTYGKGVFQNMFSVITPEAYTKYSQQYGDQYVSEIEWLSYYGVLPEASEIMGTVKLTTGHYLTPKGRSINGIGLKPAITVPDPTTPNGIELALVDPLSNTKALTVNTYDRQVYEAEQILKAAGYFTGTPDKQFDAETKTALLKYQAKSKLAKTGSVDTKTRDSLNKTLVSLRAKNDLQYAKSLEVLSLFK
ncbi:MAG: S41 family peptidase [Clostridia bacterium]|nr:S41 family peptidase [Clostridia bacterium]